MTKIAIIRCEKNENRCPLTNCFKCMIEKKEGFAKYSECIPAGVFTCRCTGENSLELAKILKAKGADVIHFCTCAFSKKTKNGWEIEDGGFCDKLDKLIDNIHKETGLPCVKGTAHLPKNYELKTWK